MSQISLLLERQTRDIRHAPEIIVFLPYFGFLILISAIVSFVFFPLVLKIL